ncbi:hypothetical protein N9W79_00695 [bacterium]|nr:hypothetical protein [bacterium]
MTILNKIVTVPSNGQISIGKGFVGKEVHIEQVSDGQIVITAGRFVPDHLETFYTADAKKKLEAFNKGYQKKKNQKKKNSSDTDEEVFNEIDKNKS